jgi:large repetitive protein
MNIASRLAVTMLLVALSTDTGTVRGRITSLWGSPLKTASIELKARNGKSFMASSDSQGNYSISNIDPGQFEITVSLGGFRVVKTTGHLSSGGDTILDVGLPVGVNDVDCKDPKNGSNFIGNEIVGSVVGGDKNPIADATVIIATSLNGQLRYNVRTAADGKFKATVADGGYYSITASAPGYSPSTINLSVRYCEHRDVRLTLARALDSRAASKAH